MIPPHTKYGWCFADTPMDRLFGDPLMLRLRPCYKYTMQTLALLLVVQAALTQTTGTVVLGGTVLSTASVTPGTVVLSSALNLGGMGVDIGEQIIKVADVVATTNNSTGLTLTVTSGAMSNGSQAIPFKVQTVPHGIVAASADFIFPSGVPNNGFSTTSAGTVARDLFISYTPPTTLNPGSYSATINLTVADNV